MEMWCFDQRRMKIDPEILNRTYGRDRLPIAEMHDNRKAAKSAGHQHYFTGNPCKHGHVAPRRTDSCNCTRCSQVFGKERRRLSAKKHWEKNKAEIKRKNLEYRKANREKLLERYRAYYKENREKILARKKAKYEENHEDQLAKRREYRRKNRDRINKLQRERYRKKKMEEQGA